MGFVKIFFQVFFTVRRFSRLLVGNCVRSKLTQADPDFLHAALDRSAYAAFFTESRTKLLGSTKLHRKSGYRPGEFSVVPFDKLRAGSAGLVLVGCTPRTNVLGYSQPELSKLANISGLVCR